LLVKLKLYALVAALICLSQAAIAGPVKQPKGWSVNYQDASCTVYTRSAGASPTDSDWGIKMGYIAGNQLIFMFSAKTSGLSQLKIPSDTKAWLTVNGNEFSALGVVVKEGEIIVPTENSLALQKALAAGKQIGARIQTPAHTSPVDIMKFDLFNIPGARRWLDSCNMIGVGALPDKYK